MASKIPKNLKNFVLPLNMNGLQGRMLKVSAPNKAREILLVYGHHATLERWFGLAEELLRYGGVTMPDLPGFGGMEPLHKIGEKPSLDIYADYLAAFIKLRYKQRRLTIVAEGFGFLVATRMLQRYPAVAKKVDLAVGLASFAHFEDLKLNRGKLTRYRLATGLFGWRLPAWALKQIYLRPTAVKRAYRSQQSSLKRRRLEASVFLARPSEQPNLWQSCDLATHMATANLMLSVDNCTTQVATPACIINVPSTYLNKHLAAQHLQVSYADCQFLEAKIGRRKLFGSDAKTAATLLPHRLRARLKAA